MTAPAKRPVGAPHRTESRIGREIWQRIVFVTADNPLGTEQAIARRVGISVKTLRRYRRDYGQQGTTTPRDELLS